MEKHRKFSRSWQHWLRSLCWSDGSAGVSRVVAVLALVVGASILIIGPMAVQGWYPVNIPTATLLFALTLCFVYGLFHQLDIQAADLFKRAAEVRERHAIFESIVEANFDGIILADNEDQVCLINPMAARLLKWRAEAAVGCRVEDILVLPEDAANVAAKMGLENLRLSDRHCNERTV